MKKRCILTLDFSYLIVSCNPDVADFHRYKINVIFDNKVGNSWANSGTASSGFLRFVCRDREAVRWKSDRKILATDTL